MFTNVKPFLKGVAITAAAMPFVLVFGFNFFTPSGAEALALARAEQMAVPLAAELCAIKFGEKPDASTQTAKLAKADSYERGGIIGPELVTLPGGRYPNGALIDACAKLILAKPEKAADLGK